MAQGTIITAMGRGPSSSIHPRPRSPEQATIAKETTSFDQIRIKGKEKFKNQILAGDFNSFFTFFTTRINNLNKEKINPNYCNTFLIEIPTTYQTLFKSIDFDSQRNYSQVSLGEFAAFLDAYLELKKEGRYKPTPVLG